MGSVREQLQPAYVLHRRPFRDSSELVDVLTAERGRQTLVAKGMGRRRRGGSLGSLLQLFQPVLVSFTGRGELPTLTAVEAAGSLAALRGEALLSGMYLNELLLRMLPRYEVHKRLFVAYGSAVAELSSLSAHGGGVEGILRELEFALLEDLGYGVDLAREADTGEPLEAAALYRLETQQGFYRSLAVARSQDDIYPGSALLAIGRGDYGASQASVAKRLVRALLRPHLGDVPLRSRQMFAMNRQASGRTGSL